jgi:hypothetical protein
MPYTCPSILASQLPHYTPSTTNQFGSVYDVTYIAPEFGATKFKRPGTSGYLRNANGFCSSQAIDYSRANHGQGKGAGDPALWPRGPTAQSRSSMGLHQLGTEPIGTTEMKDKYTRPSSTPAGRNALYPGSGLGQGAAACIHWDKDWQSPERNKMPNHGLAPCRPATAGGRNAWKLHTNGEPLEDDTTNREYGKIGPRAAERNRGQLPLHLSGDNPRDRLYSNSVQKCPVPSLGIRTYPEDEHNPIRLSNAEAEKAGISRRLEDEGWVKWNSIARTSYVKQQNLPETEGLNRCRGINKTARLAARGGNSNSEMFGDVQARVVVDETLQQPHATTARLARSLEERVSTTNRHAHREGFSALSEKFRSRSTLNVPARPSTAR